MQYKAILFDLDNTLLNYSMSELKSMQQTVKEHQLVENEAFKWESFWSLYRTINFHYWNERINKSYTIFEVLEYSFHDTLTQLGMDHADSKALADLYWNAFCAACDFEDHAKETLSALHGHYQLAIISNGIGEAQRSRLTAGGLSHYFDALIVSDEVGYWKPDKEIFEEALARLDIKHSEALFIGDSLHDDYNGAVNAGIDFCYYNRNGEPMDHTVRPKYMIDSLQHIRRYLNV